MKQYNQAGDIWKFSPDDFEGTNVFDSDGRPVAEFRSIALAERAVRAANLLDALEEVAKAANYAKLCLYYVVKRRGLAQGGEQEGNLIHVEESEHQLSKSLSKLSELKKSLSLP